MSATTTGAGAGGAGPAVIDIVGDLTVQVAAEWKARLTTALEGSDQLWIGLSQVTEIDTAGLQVLLLLRREAGQTGKQVEFASPSQPVNDVLALAHLDGELADLDAVPAAESPIGGRS